MKAPTAIVTAAVRCVCEQVRFECSLFIQWCEAFPRMAMRAFQHPDHLFSACVVIVLLWDLNALEHVTLIHVAAGALVETIINGSREV